MKLTSRIRDDLIWWKENIIYSFNPILGPNFITEIFSDASLSGWGASCKEEKTHGFWNNEERQYHINYLELRAAFFGLKCFARKFRNCDILLRIDNTTAISYINRMDGIQFEHLSSMTKKIWSWCEHRNIWIFASYIPSKDNTVADEESRKLEPETEFSLSQKAFDHLCTTFGRPDIDLFASRINNKYPNYVFWKQDPGSIAIDAFTIEWNDSFFYAFPPFTLIPKVLKKIINDNARGILVVPYWPSQAWFPSACRCSNQNLLFLNLNLVFCVPPIGILIHYGTNFPWWNLIEQVYQQKNMTPEAIRISIASLSDSSLR
ncbi:hypothetical protein ALC62_05720 [Cyphomyrmex costatus]|uniref:Enzymatic polyprotein n=1 Tax=Cyphomyrmex costatus TaxID=456900 RepID=A0A151IJK0_9HYME|nr:hypothetical protein ALC62_05720 [Cyphomyrmex costatus]